MKQSQFTVSGALTVLFLGYYLLMMVVQGNNAILTQDNEASISSIHHFSVEAKIPLKESAAQTCWSMLMMADELEEDERVSKSQFYPPFDLAVTHLSALAFRAGSERLLRFTPPGAIAPVLQTCYLFHCALLL